MSGDLLDWVDPNARLLDFDGEPLPDQEWLRDAINRGIKTLHQARIEAAIRKEPDRPLDPESARLFGGGSLNDLEQEILTACHSRYTAFGDVYAASTAPQSLFWNTFFRLTCVGLLEREPSIGPGGIPVTPRFSFRTTARGKAVLATT